MKKKIFILMLIIAVNYLSAAPSFINKTYSFLRSKIWREIPHDNRTFSGEGYKWLSFPRLDVDENGEQLSSDVLGNLQPMAEYITVYDEEKHSTSYIAQTYDYEYLWNPDDYLLTRTAGYKIKVEAGNTDDFSLFVPGERIPEDTTMDLIADHEHWLGYFRESPDHVANAFAGILGDVKYILHQDWYLYRKASGLPFMGVFTQEYWDKMIIEYGDMVVVKTFNDHDNFDWGIQLLNLTLPEEPVSQLFEYEEKAEYTPIVLELDENTTTEEVGVYVDGECKGYGKVEENDVAMIRAYLDEPTRDGNSEIEFVFANGNRAENMVISDYLVYDEKLEMMIPHKINTQEDREYYHVSVRKDGGSTCPNATELAMVAYPNPFNPTTTIQFNVVETQNVKVEIFNIKGQKIRTLMNGTAQAGKNIINWHGKDDSHNSVSSGVYFCKISIKGKSVQQKLMLLK